MPIFHDVPQGSPEWYVLRLGIPTASEFSKIITPKEWKFSSQADKYANSKIAEILKGETMGLDRPTYEMERGKLMEVEAREAYEFSESVVVSRGGFITSDDGSYGCSPDFWVNENGGGEIKCLMPPNHVNYMIKQQVDPEHVPQVQGQILLCEWDWCDWWMYEPDLPRVKIRTYRDDKFINSLSDCLSKFSDLMQEKIEILKSRGHFQPRLPAVLGQAFGGNIVPAGQTIISAG